MQGEEALEDYEFLGAQDVGASGPGVGTEVVDRGIDGFALYEFSGMGDQQLVLKSSRLVEIRVLALFQREVRQVAIVAVERKDRRVQPLSQVAGKVALSCS